MYFEILNYRWAAFIKMGIDIIQIQYLVHLMLTHECL